MSERMVNLPVRAEVRDLIKQLKKEMTYNQFFKLILEQSDLKCTR